MKVRQDSLRSVSIINPTHYESISVTWANRRYLPIDVNRKCSMFLSDILHIIL